MDKDAYGIARAHQQIQFATNFHLKTLALSEQRNRMHADRLFTQCWRFILNVSAHEVDKYQKNQLKIIERIEL